MKVTPRPYQRVAVKAALKGLRGRSHRALVVLAAGLGKTLTAAFITKGFGPKRVLFLVHSNFILDHAISEFRLVFGEQMNVAMYNGFSKNGGDRAQFVFATWQTMSKNMKKWTRSHFDLIIVDEAHHTEALTYRPVALYFTGAKLAITATPDREDKADIRGIFGSEVADISLEEAIARGWLPRIEYHVITDESLDEKALQVIAAEIREAKRRFSMAEVNRRIFIRKRDHEIARIINGYDEKATVFCASIRHAGRMSRSLGLGAVFHSKAGKSATATWNKNQATLGALHNGIVRRVCAVNAFNEGMNVPSVGLVAFCRATDSVTIYRQQLGRGLRPGKDKLVVLDFVGNLERIQIVLEMMNKISDLHERVTTREERGREGYERHRFEVSGAGFEFTFSDQVVDLMKVLQHVKRDPYPTWEEASKAVMALRITTMPGYKRGYRRDPRLPSHPRVRYANYPGDSVFFGRDKYATWEEASQAAIALGFTKMKEYVVGFKRDPRLPSGPFKFYSDYPGDSVFFGRKKKVFYRTWRQASRAARVLGFNSRTEYEAGFRKDPHLPHSPAVSYGKDHPGDAVFFGRKEKDYYATVAQASKAAKKLKANSAVEYSRLYKQDPRLPAYPPAHYQKTWKSKGWNWYRFLGKKTSK